MAKQSLESWIQEATNDPDKEDPCTHMALMHVLTGGAKDEVHTSRFSAELTVARLAQLFLHKAAARAQDLPGVQMFEVWAFYGGKPEPGARFPFTVGGRTDFDGLQTEGPTTQGLVQQAMRHSEVMAQTFVKQTAMLFEMQARTMCMVESQNTRLIAENQKAFESIKEAIIMQAQGSHEIRMKELEYQRSTEERAKLLSFAPALVNTVTGKEIFPQATADSSLIDTIADNLSEEQLEMLPAVLPPEVVGPIAARVTKRLEARRESDERIAKISENLPPEEGMGEPQLTRETKK